MKNIKEIAEQIRKAMPNGVTKEQVYEAARLVKKIYEPEVKPIPEVIELANGVPFAIICDLDGTLCDLNGRNPYDASNCEDDLLNHVVAGLIRGRRVIFMSGREDKYRAQTERFLGKHGIQYEGFL